MLESAFRNNHDKYISGYCDCNLSKRAEFDATWRAHSHNPLKRVTETGCQSSKTHSLSKPCISGLMAIGFEKRGGFKFVCRRFPLFLSSTGGRSSADSLCVDVWHSTQRQSDSVARFTSHIFFISL